MVEYMLTLNVLREQIEDEVFDIAKRLNKRLTNKDVVKYVKMIVAHIEENGLRETIDRTNTTKLEEKIKEWK